MGDHRAQHSIPLSMTVNRGHRPQLLGIAEKRSRFGGFVPGVARPPLSHGEGQLTSSKEAGTSAPLRAAAETMGRGFP